MEIPQSTLDRYANLTNENRHTEALIVLCDAIIELSSDYREQAQKQRKALMAIETLHGYKGNLLPGLFQFRCEIEQTVYNLLNLAFSSPEMSGG